MGLICPLGTFCPLGRFVSGRFVSGTFCPWDVVLSLGRFVPCDVLSLVTFCPLGHFVLGRFVLGRFVLGRFVLGGFVLGRFVCASLSVLKQHFFKRYHYLNLQKKIISRVNFRTYYLFSEVGKARRLFFSRYCCFRKAFWAVVDK